jgi:hypothetical protein
MRTFTLTDDAAREEEEPVEYKGRTYRLLWSGPTRYGQRARLEFLDGSKQFWVDAGGIRRVAGPAAGRPPPAPKPTRQVLDLRYGRSPTPGRGRWPAAPT